MGSRMEWTAGGRPRRGIGEETRYVIARSLDRGALWIAATAPLVATLVVLSAL